MALSAQLVTQGLSGALSFLNQVEARGNDWTDAGPNLLAVIQADIDERFEGAPGVRSSGTVLGGFVWPALSEAYLLRNPDREGGQQLRDTGELLQSFQVGGDGNITNVTPSSLRFGSNLPKARGLQEDRTLIGIHDGLLDVFAATFEAFVVREGPL